MKIFELEQCGRTRGDCTAPYEVILHDDNITVEEFVNAILSKETEWGRISIGEDYFNPKACAWYHHGKMDEENHELIPYYDKIITKAKADGGWSCMDYMIEIKE